MSKLAESSVTTNKAENLIENVNKETTETKWEGFETEQDEEKPAQEEQPPVPPVATENTATEQPLAPAVVYQPPPPKPATPPPPPKKEPTPAPPPARPRSPPSAAIARSRPKGKSDAPLTLPGQAPPAADTPEPEPKPQEPEVPDIFDTTKFTTDSAPSAEADADKGAEDFFAANSSKKPAAGSDVWSGGLLAPPPKTFDALQTYTDDEAIPGETEGAEGGFSSANNPFRASGGETDAFGADDLFSQLEKIGGTSAAAGDNGGAAWDDFDPFAAKPATNMSSGADFAAFGGKKKLKKKTSDSGSESQDSFDYDPKEELAPLEPFHPPYQDQVFQMGLRQPPRKSKMPFSGQRGWRTTYVKIETDPKNQNIYLKLYLSEKDAAAFKNPLQELKLSPNLTLSEIAMQPFDEMGKVYTTKVYRTDYKERPALRVDKLTPKGLTLTSIKDLKRLITKPKKTMVLDHAPEHEELMKLGSLNFEELKQFRWYFEDAMMRVITKRQQTTQQYTKDEIIGEVIDEYEAMVDKHGHITQQKSRVRIYCLAFLSGMAFVEFGVNDLRRKGKEVVRRQDIIPMRTEHWIRIEDYQFHCCVNMEEFNKNTVIRFQPPDGINVEILRFRTRPKKNYQLPLQIRCMFNIDKANREVEIRMEVLIPGYFSNSRKANQAPCENISISLPVPEPWIYYFRVEHVWGYGSVHAHKARLGKVKGLDRITNMAEGLIPKGSNPSNCVMEVNTGDCKYEHLLNGLVWRIPRLPERFQGAYKTHLMTVKLPLGPHDPMPETFEKHVTVNYTMPATSVSKAMIRSISSTTQADEPPDKWVKQLARFYYKVEIEYTFEEHSKMPADQTEEKPMGIELPSTIAPGEKVEVKVRDPGLAVSDEDSSDEEVIARRKQAQALRDAENPAPPAAAGDGDDGDGAPAVPTGLAESDATTESEDEGKKPSFKIQLNPAIQSFIQKGGAMGAGPKKPPQHPPPPNRPDHPPPPHRPDHPPPPHKGGSEPPRPPPPRPANPPVSLSIKFKYFFFL